MDVPLEPSSGMLSLHLEAEGGTEGKSLFFAEPSHSGQKSGDAASISDDDDDAHEKKKKSKKRRRAERAAAEAAKKKNKQRKSLKHAQVIAEDARPCLTSMLTKTLAKIVYCTKKHFGARPKARDVRKT